MYKCCSRCKHTKPLIQFGFRKYRPYTILKTCERCNKLSKERHENDKHKRYLNKIKLVLLQWKIEKLIVEKIIEQLVN